jgi:hypothetical protein
LRGGEALDGGVRAHMDPLTRLDVERVLVTHGRARASPRRPRAGGEPRTEPGTAAVEQVVAVLIAGSLAPVEETIDDSLAAPQMI